MKVEELEAQLKRYQEGNCYVKVTTIASEEHPFHSFVGEIDYYGPNQHNVPFVRIKRVPHLAHLFPKQPNNESTLQFGYDSIIDIQKCFP